MSGAIQIGDDIVTLGDPRIGEYCNQIERLRGLNEISMGRSRVKPDEAAHQATKLKDITDSLSSEFVRESAVNKNKVGNIQAADKLLGLAAKQGHDPRSARYVSSYTYMRSFRILAADLGPDSSPGFKLAYQAATQKAAEFQAKVLRYNRPQLFDYTFSEVLIGDTLKQVFSPTGQFAVQAKELISQQADVLSDLGGRFLEVIEYNENLKSDFISLDDLIGPAAEDEIEEISAGHLVTNASKNDDDAKEKPKKINAWEESEILELAGQFDVAIYRMIARLVFQESNLLNLLPGSQVNHIISIGANVMKYRQLIAKDIKIMGEYKEFIIPDGLEPACAPGPNGEIVSAVFFPHRGDAVKYAQAICDGCEIKIDCLKYALDNNIRNGIWGGTSERERRRMRTSYNLKTKEDAFFTPSHITINEDDDFDDEFDDDEVA